MCTNFDDIFENRYLLNICKSDTVFEFFISVIYRFVQIFVQESYNN